eukprot:SAG31_NODE_11991_length_979_cov_1.634091_1_plen_75_part_00
MQRGFLADLVVINPENAQTKLRLKGPEVEMCRSQVENQPFLLELCSLAEVERVIRNSYEKFGTYIAGECLALSR